MRAKATSVAVERLFSKECLILSHVPSRMSVQTTRTLLCLNSWYKHGFVKTDDVLAVAREPEVVGVEARLERDWDRINV